MADYQRGLVLFVATQGAVKSRDDLAGTEAYRPAGNPYRDGQGQGQRQAGEQQAAPAATLVTGVLNSPRPCAP